MARPELEAVEVESTTERCTDPHAPQGVWRQIRDSPIVYSCPIPPDCQTSDGRWGGTLSSIKSCSSELTSTIQSAVEEVIERMDAYYLSKEDWDTVVELGVDDKKDDLVLKKISSATKTNLTRKYVE